jgi:hypothetical protein
LEVLQIAVTQEVALLFDSPEPLHFFLVPGQFLLISSNHSLFELAGGVGREGKFEVLKVVGERVWTILIDGEMFLLHGK